MFRDGPAARRFCRAFVVSWLIQFSLGLVAIGFSSVVLVNFLHVIGGGQYAPSEVSMDAFLRTVAIQAPTSALFVACYVVASLFVASYLTSKYPRNRYAAYALAGGVVPLALGLLAMSLNWLGAVIGAISLLPAARLTRV